MTTTTTPPYSWSVNDGVATLNRHNNHPVNYTRQALVDAITHIASRSTHYHTATAWLDHLRMFKDGLATLNHACPES